MIKTANSLPILIGHNKTIEVDDSAVFIDNQPVSDDDLNGKSAKDYAYEKSREYYKQYFSSHFENFIVLSGAGTSVDVGVNDKKGQTREGLWESVKTEVTSKSLRQLCKIIKYKYPQKGCGDIEAILSKAEKAKDYVKDINTIVKKIKNHIKNICSLELPPNSPHQLLIHKLTSRKSRDPRVKLFTLNYDTLFEQAAQNGFTVIDGFSYGNPRVFNGSYFDYDFVIRENSRIEKEENYVSRVIHIYKLHGSLDWERQKEEIVKSKESDVKDPLIIYPNYEKYEISYVQPFFEMMLRFQQSLRKDNVLLLVIGFSFYDKHITAIIKEALKTNPSFRMAIVTKDLSGIVGFGDFRNSVSGGNVLLIDELFEIFVTNYPFPKIYQSDFLKTEPAQAMDDLNAK